MTPTRELLWNVPHWAEVVMYAGAAVVFVMILTDMARRVVGYRRGAAGSTRTDALAARLADVGRNALLQLQLARDRFSGLMHLTLFWGFVVLLIGTIILAFQIDFGFEFFHGDFYLVFSVFMEVAGLAFLGGVMLAMYRRWLRRPERLTNRWDDHYALVILWLLGASGFLIEGARIVSEDFPSYERWSFVGYGVASVLGVFADGGTWETVHRWGWVSHMALAIGFLGLLTYTKFLHVLTAPANILLRDRRPKGSMTWVPDVEEAEQAGATAVTDLSRPDLADLDACTRCGRCHDACPAQVSGKPLSPRDIILKAQALMRAELGDDPDKGETLGLHDVITEDEVWSCITCRSCVEQCPVGINQLDKILELRRYLTNSGALTGSAAKALESMGMRGNPWQLKQADRFGWADGAGVDVPIMALLQDPEELAPGEELEPVDYVFYVGCAGSYDPRAQKVAQAIVRLLDAAGVSYGVLADEETCTCEAARRMGEEMLFQVGASALKETLDGYRFKRILTMCPHCLNTFRNDYPQLGAEWEVVHHTELLLDLVRQRRLPLPADEPLRVTYHDSCYLGRYNDIYDAPRDLLRSVLGAQVVEMPRNGSESFCCGGGGGQMWAEIKIGEPVEFIRTREALATGVDQVATACPYCKIMLDDGRKHLEREDVQVRDLAELLDGALRGRDAATSVPVTDSTQEV